LWQNRIHFCPQCSLAPHRVAAEPDPPLRTMP
jgi:hypothetical protein